MKWTDRFPAFTLLMATVLVTVPSSYGDMTTDKPVKLRVQNLDENTITVTLDNGKKRLKLPRKDFEKLLDLRPGATFFLHRKVLNQILLH